MISHFPHTCVPCEKFEWMPTFAERFETVFRKTLPSPLSIALVLTFIAFSVALFSTCPQDVSHGQYALDLLNIWQNGMWQSSLLAFTVQMMLILVLGHTLALSKPVSRFIDKLTERIQNGTQAAVLVGVLTILVALFNWGLALIFGAVFARKVAEMAHRKSMAISYPLVGASGYIGLMVWHGGISGSAPLKASEAGHISEISGLAGLPTRVDMADTLFSSMNIYASIAILVVSALAIFTMSKFAPKAIPTRFSSNVSVNLDDTPPIGAEVFDKKKGWAILWAIVIILSAIYTIIQAGGTLHFLTPNFINFTLLGLALLFHGTLNNFMSAVDEAIQGAAGILIQFPLYFGIMALVRDSGLIADLSAALIANSSPSTFPIITLFTSGFINIFVPSGGGQWAIQAPLLIEASQALNIPLGKSIMSLAYGDQLTNMLQPFWALPLLGITKLKAREILPYTVILMLTGTLVYVSALILF